MAAVAPKKFALRAFKIANPNLTEPNSGLMNLLGHVLNPESTAAERRMPLNVDEPDRELLANYIWSANNSFLFGMMLRVIPADNGGVIDEELFNQHTITMAQVTSGNREQSQYKDHFYFALNDDYLVTTLPGNVNINRLQTYINWLLENVRGDRLFEFAELTRLPEGIQLSQIRDIQFRGGGYTVNAHSADSNGHSLSVRLSDITRDFLTSVISDANRLNEIRDNQLIDACLYLKLKSKPRDMRQEEFQRVMSAIATNITSDSGIVLRTKDGNRFTGAAIKIKKTVSVECLEANRIVEEQLKQEMERFLGEIRNQQNA